MMRVKLLKAILLSVLCFITAAPVCYAASVFDRIEQKYDYNLSYIAATSNTCIAVTPYYVTKYTGDGWSDAVYIPDSGYIIDALCSDDDYFYTWEYNKSLGKSNLMRSADGENWECILTRENANVGGVFFKTINGDLALSENIALPEGFTEAQLGDARIYDYSVEFNGETIAIDESDCWYSVTDTDGERTTYQKPEREDNLKPSYIIGAVNEFTINDVTYIARSYDPLQNFKKEDIKYNIKIENKYYYITLGTGSYKPGISCYIYIYEDDEDGNLKRDEDGEVVREYISYRNTVSDFKYVDGIFYAEFWLGDADGSRKEWKSSTDLLEWTDCEEPLEKEGVAETIGDTVKISLGNSIKNVNYENEIKDTPSRGFDSTYLSPKPYKIGDYYYVLSDNEFLLSKDGVYYTSFELPDNFRAFDYVYITEDGDDFVIQSGIYQICAPKNEIYSKVEEASEEPIYVALNDTLLAFETAPVIENDRTLIPIRFLFEQMGAEVSWDSDAQTAVISQNDTVITFTADNTEASVNGEGVSMDVPARIINGKTMVPLRFLSETLGYTVTWYDEIAMAEITY